MAGVAGSHKDLWQFITGTGLLRPEKAIEEEIKRNKDKLLHGLSFYKKQSTPSGEALKKEKKLDALTLDFIVKLSNFLGLDELQTHSIFCSYLQHDYRGSQKELNTVLKVERHAQALIVKVRDYYFSERLYLLRCIKHIFSYWQDPLHSYRKQYTEFVEVACDNDKFIKEARQQYEAICDEVAPTWETHGNLMNEKQAAVWLLQNLREQCELLEILLLFYKDFQHPAESLEKLLAHFKRQGFGRRQTNKHLLDERAEPLLHRIGCLEVLILVEAVDLEHLQTCQKTNSVKNHPLMESSEFKKINSLMCSLVESSHPQVGPILLMWSVVRFLALENSEANITHRLGNAALQKHAFRYLADMLNTEPFSGKTTVAGVAHVIVYGLLSLVLGLFHEDTLGDTQALYSLAAKLLAQPLISDNFWHKGTSEGMGTLLQSAISQFPLDFNPLLSLSTALASANKRSAVKVVRVLENLPTYTEYLDKNTTYDIDNVGDATWQLMRDKRPYHSDHIIIRQGTVGQQLSHPGSLTLRDSPVIQWEHSYNALNLFWCEVNHLLEQVAHGARMVSIETVRKVASVARLLTAILTSAPVALDHAEHITNLFSEVIQRFCLLNPPDLDLLSSCVEALTCVSKQRPKQVWHSLQQTGLLPFLTENFSDLTEATSGAGLNAGSYGGILAGAECPSGSFPLTLAFLDLTSTLVQLLHEAKCLEELTASVLFISREIFPVFHKWRYAQFGKREQLGQRCLQVFHKILNILTPDSPDNKSELALRDVVVHSLLYSESGRALLAVISTGVDRVEVSLAMQGSAVEGVGIELIRLIRLAFSVLNRLLLLRPPDSALSPVEHSLSAQPANGASRHVVATIAQYIYHHHDPKLTTLATLLLKRLAMVFPMSLLACLGNEAEAIRDVYLSRLQAATQDIRLKVVILELLAVCVETQPGLTELFLNVQPAKEGAGKDLLLGRTSCLQTALSLMEENKQGTYQCPSDLLCATLEFVHALWHGRRETAMAVLREKPTYWRSVGLSLIRDLPQPNEMEVDQEVLEREIKTCAYIMKILAVELHCVQSDKLDENLQKVLKEVVAEKRFEYWSAYLRENLKCTAEISELPMEVLSENSTLKLLTAWRNLALVLASQRIEAVTLTSTVKDQLIRDVLDGLQALFSNGMTALHIKLSSVASAFAFTLLQHWKGYIKDWSAMVQQLESVLTETCANSETLIPPVQIGILGSLTTVLQHIRSEEIRDVDQAVLGQLAHVVCSVLQQSTYQLPTPSIKQDPAQTGNPTLDIKLKLQILNVCLLEELVHLLDSGDSWLPILKQHFILPCLLSSIQMWMECKQGMQYVQAVLMLFTSLAKVTSAAEALALNGVTKHTCLVLSTLYPTDSSLSTVAITPTKVKSNKESPPESLTWVGIYRLGLGLFSTMLKTLRYNFLEDALNFVGVHQDRMFQCLESVKVNLTSPCLLEAEDTCRFLAELSHYRREWRLHLPQVLNKLMTSLCYLCQSCISLLIRPRLLHHMLEKQSGKESNKHVPLEKLTMTPITRRLSQQSSSDDGDSQSSEVMLTQHRLLLILSECLAAMRLFSPDLCEILLDQSMDVGEYEPILAVGFSTPSLEQDSPPSFGTLVSGTNLCITLLTKLDPRPASPVKSPDADNLPVKRPVVMFVLENTLHLIMSQAMRYLREPGLAPRDKQLLKRELRSELNTFLLSMQRHLLRRGAPPSPAAGTSQLASPQGLTKTLSQSSFASSQEQAFFRLIDNFVKNILR